MPFNNETASNNICTTYYIMFVCAVCESAWCAINIFVALALFISPRHDIDMYTQFHNRGPAVHAYGRTHTNIRTQFALRHFLLLQWYRALEHRGHTETGDRVPHSSSSPQLILLSEMRRMPRTACLLHIIYNLAHISLVFVCIRTTLSLLHCYMQLLSKVTVPTYYFLSRLSLLTQRDKST